MWLFFLLGIILTNYNYVYGHCIDIHSQIVSQGLHYVPGSNPCTLCICDNGSPKWCKSVLCSPPQNCKSFEIGNSCCEFKCLDDILTAHDNYKDTYEVALRFIASAVTAVLSLSLLFFLFHRFRRRKVLVHQNQQLNEDQRSLNSIGYITGSLSYLPDNMGYLGSGNNELEFRYEESSAHYSLWKPHGNYFPQGEAPPPYEEAVRAAQLENDIINTQIRNTNNGVYIPQNNTNNNLQNVHRQTQIMEPMQMYTPMRNDAVANNSNISNTNSGNSPHYVNITVQNTTAIQNRDNNKTDCQNIVVHHPPKVKNVHDKVLPKSRYLEKPEKPYENVALNSSNSGSSSSGGAGGGMTNIPNGNNKHVSNKRNKSTASGYNKIQKQENTYENLHMDKNNSSFNRPEIVLESRSTSDDLYKIRKSERSKENDKPVELYEEISVYDNRHRTILNLSEYQSHSPLISKNQKENGTRLSNRDRKLRIGERSESNLKNLLKLSEIKELPLHRTLPKNLHELLSREIPNDKTDNDNLRRSQSSNYETCLLNPSKSHGSLIDNAKCERTNDALPVQGIPLNFLSNKESKSRNLNEDDLSFVSYQCLSSSQDDDDYRSECENCKSSGFTISKDEEADVLNETMTLQRRPIETGEDVPYYRTSLTLPTQTRKPRPINNANRENWFTSMQETSSSEESD